MGVSEPMIQASLLGEAVENGPTAIFVTDDLGKYVAVNHAACDLLGYSREELLTMRLGEVARAAGEAARWSALSESDTRVGTTTLTRKDGTTVLFMYVAAATVVAGMSVFVAVGAPTS